MLVQNVPQHGYTKILYPPVKEKIFDTRLITNYDEFLLNVSIRKNSILF